VSAVGSSGLAVLAGRLATVVGDAHVLSDPDLTRAYEHDLTGRFSGESLLVVRPAHAAEVGAVLTACAEAGVGVVVQGGHTGMVGGGTPRDGEVVLSMGRFQTIEPLEPSAAQVTVGAGVTLERLQQMARAKGLDFAIDHGARSAATIGGMTATNAGGHLAVRYGTMREQVVGIEAVLPDGRTISHLSGLLKDNAGFDLAGLLVGSEGTLAAITRVRLKLIPSRAHRATALFGVAGMEEALRVLERLRAQASSLEAIDFFQARGLRHVCRRLDLPPPFPADYPVYLLVETAADTDPTDELAAAADLVEDSAVAVDERARGELWAYRDAHNETVRSLGVPLKLDVSVPPAASPSFEQALRELLAARAPAAELILWGHLGDGNMHVNIVGAGGDSDEVEEAVLRLVATSGGSISAEHGVGQAKARWLHLCRSDAELSVMRAVKAAFDPNAILGRGRVLAEAAAAAPA
jgi:FAD/FMN-containing dehydrogenase